MLDAVTECAHRGREGHLENNVNLLICCQWKEGMRWEGGVPRRSYYRLTLWLLFDLAPATREMIAGTTA